jgi:hypothetical protein
MLRTVSLGLIVILGGCGWSHTFNLDDLERLELGKTTRAELEQRLGPPEFPASDRYSSSARDTVVPPAPLSFILWPVFFHFHERDFVFATEWTSEGVLKSGTLEIFEMSRWRTILLLFGSSSYQVELEAGELDALRRLEKKGLKVRIATQAYLCFGGIMGWDSVPLDEFLRNPRQD